MASAPSPDPSRPLPVPQPTRLSHNTAWRLIKSWLSLETVAASCMDQISMLTDGGDVRVAYATCSRCTDSVAIGFTCALCSVQWHQFVSCLQFFVAMLRNPTWEWFCKSETDASKAKCAECSKQLSLRRDKPAKQTVSGLQVHLEKFHKEQFVS